MSDLTRRLREGDHGFDRNGSHSEDRYVCLCEHLAHEAADRIDALEECLRESVYCLEHDVTVERSMNLLDKARALLEGK